MIDPGMFTVERLLHTMFYDMHGGGDVWRKYAEIIPKYVPTAARPEDEPKCVVRLGAAFLRYSRGPAQGYFWDVYGDDMQRPELALLALLEAPVPPLALRRDAFDGTLFR